MGTDSSAAASPAFAGSRAAGRAKGWHLPFGYSGIAPTAFGLDVAIILASAISAQAVYLEFPSEFDGPFSRTLAAATFVAALFIASMRVQELYDPTRLLIFNEQVKRVVGAWCGAFLILASGVFTSGVSRDMSRGDILLFWGFGLIALIAHRAAWRIVLPRALQSGALKGRAIVSLSCEKAIPPSFVDSLIKHGYRASAHVHVPRDEAAAGPVIDRVVALCRSSEIEEIVVLVDPQRMTGVAEVLRRLRVLPLPVTLAPFGPLAPLFQRARTDIGATVGIEAQRAPLSPGELAQKRVFDIVVSGAAILALAPLMLAAALAIRLDSSGPILFRQTRHGFNGRPFGIYKFRTMTVLEDGDVVTQARANDKRVTRVGRWLRRLSLDETPQLINVLFGHMSLVGPRPHAAAHDRHFAAAIETYAFRHHVKSGITGWAQVSGARGETDTLDKMRRRVELDLWYIDNWSLWLDFSILVRTAFVVLAGENAH